MTDLRYPIRSALSFFFCGITFGMVVGYWVRLYREPVFAAAQQPDTGPWTAEHIAARARFCAATCDRYAPCEERCVHDFNQCHMLFEGNRTSRLWCIERLGKK